MSLLDYTLGATIPTGQYANLQPQVNVTAETFAEAHAEASAYIEAVWKQYGTVPLVKRGGTTRRLKDIFDNEIDYDEANHVYSWEGETYESGSQYANKFRKPFDKQKIASLMADKVGANPADIIAMWELKAQASRDFGNAIHAALQLYEQYNGLADQLNKTTHSHDHPVIKQAVDSFMEAHKGEQALSEALIVDHTNKRAGRVDRLLITDGVYTVQDFKTNADIKKELEFYWKQLDFYGEILVANAAKIHPPQIFHWNGEWKDYSK